jgi:hypothetical protein
LPGVSKTRSNIKCFRRTQQSRAKTKAVKTKKAIDLTRKEFLNGKTRYHYENKGHPETQIDMTN